MSIDPKTVTALKAIFNEQGITTVGIVDDAYYEVPDRSSFTDEELNALFDRIQRWEEPSQEYQQLNLNLASADDLADGVIGQLYGLKVGSPEITSWFRDYDNLQTQRRGQLVQLEDFLDKDLRVTIQKLTPKDRFDQEHLPQVIFVDYYLDPSDQVENSLALARAVGEKIEASYPDEKPLVILMSSKDSITAIQKNQFRESANLIAGLFHFVPKSQLTKDVVFVLKLAVLLRSVSDGKRIQHFVDSFDRALSKATTQFSSQVRALTLEDYAHIQHLSLQHEGMPLGDYLLWLFGTYFGQLVFSAIPTERAELDAMTFSFIPESDMPPTKEFVDLYRQVVAGVAEGLGVHPRADKRTRDNQQWSPPDPHFGDVFIDDAQTEALMIITPECDLTYTPEVEGERPAKPDNTILMLPGKLIESSVFEHNVEPHTSLFPLEEKTYRIDWDVKGLRAYRFSELRMKMSELRMKRRARIRHPFSSYAQAHALNDVARVAIPIGPPLLRKVGVEVHSKYVGDQAVAKGPADAIVTQDRSGKDLIMLKLNATAAIVEVASAVATAVADAALKAEPDSNEQKKLKSHEERVNAFISDLDKITGLKRTFQLAVGGSYSFPNTPIEVLRDRTKLEARLKSMPIVVLIEEDPASKQ